MSRPPNSITIPQVIEMLVMKTRDQHLRDDNERWKRKHVERLERQRQMNINTKEAELIRAALRNEQ